MRPFLPARLLLLVFVFLAGMLITRSATVASPVIDPSSALSLNLPWTMSGCWEHELFIPKSAASLAAQSN